MALRQVRRLKRVSPYDSTSRFSDYGEPVEAETEREAIEASGAGGGHFYTARVVGSDDDPCAPPIFRFDNKTGEVVESE